MHLASRSVRTLVASALCCSALWSTATPAEPYVRFLAGAGFLGSEDLTARGSLTGSTTAETDTGWVTTGALGWAIGAWRVEADLSYRRNGLERATFNGAPSFSDGDFASLVIGANLIREFGPLADGRIMPYVGAGLAYVEEVDIDLEGGAGVERSFSDSAVGPQLLAGARYALGPRWDLFAEYRYVHASGLTLQEEGGTGRIDADYGAHSVTAGIGFRF